MPESRLAITRTLDYLLEWTTNNLRNMMRVLKRQSAWKGFAILDWMKPREVLRMHGIDNFDPDV